MMLDSFLSELIGGAGTGSARGGVECGLEVGCGGHEFGEGGCVAEEHGAEHFGVVGLPVGEVLGWWCQAEAAGLVGGVVHP